MLSTLATLLPAGLLACTLCAQALAQTASTSAQGSACSDFDTYVNGTWNASTEVPASRSRIGSFDVLRIANDRVLESALAELAADPARQTSPGLKLLAAYYRSGMDEAAIAKAGLSALVPWLARIDTLTREDIPVLIADLARQKIDAPLALSVQPDAKDVRRHVLGMSQGGIGLPDRDDYAKTDATTLRIKSAYRQYVSTLLQSAGAKTDDAVLDALTDFETTLANASMTNVHRRDPNAVYNPLSVAALQNLAPGMDWRLLLGTYAGRRDGVPVVLGQPAFAQALATLAQTAPISTWRNYLRVRLLDATAAHGPQSLAQANFAYRSGAIRGLKAEPPRIETVILAIGGQYGGAPISESLGELFASKLFSPLAQQRAQQMLADIRAGMRQRVQASPWMSAPTKLLALEKLDGMVAKIGVPERWKTFTGLELRPDDNIGNLLRASAWATAERLAELDKPVDRTRWNTSPHIVNAFAGGGNQIIFPAGILQPPFFDPNADDASNYGGIGMIIGHEITHHFDDRGRQFDAVGNLRDWWTTADAAAYKTRADRVAAMYGSYEPLPGERINGQLTLGENLSDVGGIQIAYAGLQIALERQRQTGKTQPMIEGQTPEQRFFASNAIVWRNKYRTEALINQLRTDSHSPGRWRVLGPMSNMSAFAQAFNCKVGDAMVAVDPIVVW